MGVGVEPQNVFVLEQIVEREGKRNAVVLFDTNVYDLSLLENTYELRSYRQLDPNRLRHAVDAQQRLLQWIAEPNLHTVEGVHAECQQQQVLFTEKTRYWNAREKARRAHHKGGGKDRQEEQEQLVGQLNADGLRLIKALRHAILRPVYPELYRHVVDAVIGMEDQLHLKQKGGKIDYQQRRWRREYADRRTDEQLVAMGLYLSLVEGKPSAIVSRDGDIEKLLVMKYDLLSATNYLPFSSVMRGRFKAYPCRLYSPTVGFDEPYLQYFDTERIPKRLPGNAAIPFSRLQDNIYALLLQNFKPVVNHQQPRLQRETAAEPILVSA